MINLLATKCPTTFRGYVTFGVATAKPNVLLPRGSQAPQHIAAVKRREPTGERVRPTHPSSSAFL